MHKVRPSLLNVVWRERRAVARDLRAIYGATMLAEAEEALEQLTQPWDAHDPISSGAWPQDWACLTVGFDYSIEIRQAIDTINAIESLNYSLRNELTGHRAFLTDGQERADPIPLWKRSLNQVVLFLEDRMQTRDEVTIRYPVLLTSQAETRLGSMQHHGE